MDIALNLWIAFGKIAIFTMLILLTQECCRRELLATSGRRITRLPRRLTRLDRNNHTKTVLIKSLLGPLALTSYWLTLTY